jgi:lipopolysaccharide transport system ATP-binding protein
MAHSKEISLSVRGLSKKFTKDVTYNMLYGTLELFNPKSRSTILRKKEFWALKDLDLDFYKGEICAIIGSNGSGKTTLIRVLADIYGHEIGMVEKHGNSITPVFAVKAGLNPVLSGKDNIFLLGALYGLTRDEINEKMDEIVEFSELGSFIDMPVGNYSSGMKARLGYTVAMASDPDIFVVDEALAVGDVSFRQKCFEHLERWSREDNKSIIFVTNNNLKVEKIAQRVIIMKNGRKVMDTEDIDRAMSYYVSDEYKSLSFSVE